MHLERNHIRSFLNTRRHQNDVELREDRGVVDLNRFRVGVEVVNQVEASHAVAVEVHSHTSSVLHAHIQHLIVVHIRQLEALADVRGYRSTVRNLRSLLRLPRRIIEVSRVPSSWHRISLIHLPLRKLHLEGEER